MAQSLSIRLKHLVVQADHRSVLQVPRLEVGVGEWVGVLGPNGAGKTTLCRCLLGLQSNTVGRVEVGGRNLADLNESQKRRVRQRIGYVPQVLPVSGELPLTVREVVAMGRTAKAGLFRRLARSDWEVVDRWLERLGLSTLAQRTYTELSGGEQRKTLIARALTQEPEILVLDEPGAYLDLGWRDRLVECISELRVDPRLTLVLVSHELEMLPAACRRVLLLSEGCLVADGTPEQVFDAANIATLYGRSFEILHRHGRHIVFPGGGER